MNAKRLLSTFLVLFALPLLAACMSPPEQGTPALETPQVTEPTVVATPENTPEQETPVAEEPAADAQALAGTAWNLESLGPVGSETPVIEDTTLVISFDSDTEFGGTGGCNSFGGGYALENGTFMLGEFGTTFIACEDQAIMQQELRFYEALRDAVQYELTGDELIIWYDEGESAMHFTRAG